MNDITLITVLSSVLIFCITAICVVAIVFGGYGKVVQMAMATLSKALTEPLRALTAQQGKVFGGNCKMG